MLHNFSAILKDSGTILEIFSEIYSMKRYILYIIGFCLLSSCASMQQSIDSGDYDMAIDIAVKKLQGKKKEDETILALKKAYDKATEQDKTRLNQIKGSGKAAYWPEIYELYSQMDNRQSKIIPLLPLKLQNGEVVDFERFNLFDVKEEARTNAAAYYYEEGKTLLSSGRKQDARKAYELFNNVKIYYAYYKDTEDLLSEAYLKGTNKVFVMSDKKGGILLPPKYEEDLAAIDFQANAPDWVHFFWDNQTVKQFDYIVKIYFSDIQITPETVKEVHYDETKEIQDGWNYVYDFKGNVMKDSLGNDIKVPKMVKISCHITESQQNKAAKVLGEVEIRDGFTNKLIEKVPVAGNAVFSNFYAVAQGNQAALKEETKAKLGNKPRPFPTDFQMIDMSKEEMKNAIYRAVYDRYNIFSN